MKQRLIMVFLAAALLLTGGLFLTGGLHAATGYVSCDVGAPANNKVRVSCSYTGSEDTVKWTWGDGSIPTYTLVKRNVEHDYTSNGTYEVEIWNTVNGRQQPLASTTVTITGI